MRICKSCGAEWEATDTEYDEAKGLCLECWDELNMMNATADSRKRWQTRELAQTDQDE